MASLHIAWHHVASRDPTIMCSTLRDVFLEINSSLLGAGINALFGGCTAVVALVRGQRMWVANLGDSRAVVVGRGEDGSVVARGLTWDQVRIAGFCDVMEEGGRGKNIFGGPLLGFQSCRNSGLL